MLPSAARSGVAADSARGAVGLVVYAAAQGVGDDGAEAGRQGGGEGAEVR